MDLICANGLCAKVFRYTSGPAHFARHQYHYCSRSCQMTTHGLDGTLRHRLWEQAKRRAKINDVAFSLLLSDVPDVPELCPVLGILIRSNAVAGPIDSSPSLDRIHPTLGYAPGNVRVISFRANRLRSDGTAAELRAIADDAERIAQ